jgi:hypothetical protein
MRKFTLIILTLCLIPVLSFGQKSPYPLPIVKGETKTIVADTVDLWILTARQYKVVISDSKELKLTKEQVEVLESKADVLKQQGNEKDSLVTILTKDRDYYKKYWETSEEDIQILGKEVKKQKFIKRLSFIGIAVAFVVGLLI